MNSLMWLYMFMCIYVVGGYICLCAYMLLVVIYVYVHICCWWWYMLCAYMLLVMIYVMCIYVVGDYMCCVHICCWWISLTWYWWRIVGVSMYWDMLVWTCGIRMKYVLLLSSPSSHTVVVGFHLHVGVEYLCIQLCEVFMRGVMMCLLHQGQRPRRWNWYHTHLELV